MPQVLNLEQLTRTATQHDATLRELPAVLLEPFAEALHLNIVETDRDLRQILLRRRGGMLRPYQGTVSQVQTQSLLDVQESVLNLRAGYMALEDNILNYLGKDLRVAGGRLVDNRQKEHPYAYEVIAGAVRTFVEDVTLAVAHAKHGSGDSPLGAFDGYNALIDAYIADGRIAAEAGNLIPLGPVAAPTSETDTKALSALVDWVRQLHPALRSGELDLIVPTDLLQHALDAYERHRRFTGELSLSALEEYLRVKAGITGRLSILTHPVVGHGTRLIACRRGTITLGISSPQDAQFVQVRSPYTDPNVVQFWMQAQFGTRIDDWHAKQFATSGGTIAPAVWLFGDYATRGDGGAEAAPGGK